MGVGGAAHVHGQSQDVAQGLRGALFAPDAEGGGIVLRRAEVLGVHALGEQFAQVSEGGPALGGGQRTEVGGDVVDIAGGSVAEAGRHFSAPSRRSVTAMLSSRHEKARSAIAPWPEGVRV